MKLRTVNPFPIPGTECRQRRELVWNQKERATLIRAADLLAQACELWGGIETDEGMDLAKGEVVIREWLEDAGR